MAVVIFNTAFYPWISLKIIKLKNRAKIVGSRNKPSIDATRSFAIFELWPTLNYFWSLRYASMNI